VWGAPKRPDIVHSVVRWQLANKRQGTAMVRGSRCFMPCDRAVFVTVWVSDIGVLTIVWIAGKDSQSD
jgi:hypothetical protein